MKPYRVRFMAEVGCEYALWGDPWRPCPASGDHDVEDLEHVLPVSDDLRDRILAWADRYRRYDGGERELDMWDFDGRGMHMSRELQRELGRQYAVHYFFTFAGARAKWLTTVADDPCPGWTAS
ncbi:hypothetical protein [Nocardioides flavescens]|uniref:Uncharacterized protein n=1 Tax=Nocardioides flavescens TaxID=2691959 RepID=A0A6L7EW89_9ACTN|nr:hypothetical protein [Nocardioides flavescens]MXG88249.1 hypothetical protein [Nocardioides flavescens]